MSIDWIKPAVPARAGVRPVLSAVKRGRDQGGQVVPGHRRVDAGSSAAPTGQRVHGPFGGTVPTHSTVDGDTDRPPRPRIGFIFRRYG